MHVSKHSMWYFLGKNFGSKQTLRLKQSTRLCFLFSFQTVFYGQYSGGAQFRNIQLLYPASVCTRYGFLLSVKEISWVALDYVVVSVMVTWGTRTERRCNCCIFLERKTAAFLCSQKRRMHYFWLQRCRHKITYIRSTPWTSIQKGKKNLTLLKNCSIATQTSQCKHLNHHAA